MSNNQKFELILKAAKLGHVLSQKKIESFYHYGGDNVNKDVSEAMKWYTLAAEKGNVDAKFHLAWTLVEHVSENMIRAMQLYTEAAKQGHMDAQFHLALLLHFGRDYGHQDVPKNISEAVHWYIEAADQGHELAQNNLNLLIHFGGQDLMKDLSEGEQVYVKTLKVDVDVQSEFDLGWFQKEASLKDMECFIVNKINDWGVDDDGEVLLQVYWRGYDDVKRTWEPLSRLCEDVPDMVTSYIGDVADPTLTTALTSWRSKNQTDHRNTPTATAASHDGTAAAAMTTSVTVASADVDMNVDNSQRPKRRRNSHYNQPQSKRSSRTGSQHQK